MKCRHDRASQSLLRIHSDTYVMAVNYITTSKPFGYCVREERRRSPPPTHGPNAEKFVWSGRPLGRHEPDLGAGIFKRSRKAIYNSTNGAIPRRGSCLGLKANQPDPHRGSSATEANERAERQSVQAQTSTGTDRVLRSFHDRLPLPVE